MQRLQRITGHLGYKPPNPDLIGRPQTNPTSGYLDAKPILHGYRTLSQTSGSQSLRGRTILITGGSRGIGFRIAKQCAKLGANLVIVAKTTEPQPNLPGTIYTAAQECRDLGGQALAVKCDIRSWEEIQETVQKAVDRFGGIDVLINNASAISLTNTDDTSPKKFDLMHQVNTRGTYLMSKACLPWLRKSSNAHILNISPPLDLSEHWFSPHTGYTIAKYGMSLCVLGLAGELRDDGVAVNALWPQTSISTSAVKNVIGGDEMMRRSRSPQIMADAAIRILSSPAKQISGNFFVDELLLRFCGITEFSQYASVPGTKEEDILPDFFV